ncbi:tetratricopeptide repeat protein [candidate division KSB1 bacterium]|nr:tetratricopeptide repeat protein [candidate division KSB1 bacterium]
MKINFKFMLVSLILLAAPSAFSQDYAQKEYNYLTQLRQSAGDKLTDFLIAEYEHYLIAYPFSEKTPEVLLQMCERWQQQGKEFKALSSYLKLFYIFPDFAASNNIRAKIEAMVSTERSLRNRKEKILSLLVKPRLATESAQRYFNFLESLSVLAGSDMEQLVDQLITESYFFHDRYPDDVRRDSLSIWVADIYRRYGEYREASSEYLKFDYLYTSSTFLPYARYQRGILAFEKLKEPQEAIDILQSVVKQHKTSEYARKSHFAIGQVYEEKLKNYQQAIGAYRLVVTDFNDGKDAVSALERIAIIQHKRLRTTAEAVKTYREILEKFTEQVKSPRLYVECAELYLKDLKDYNQAATFYALAAEKNPKHEDASSLWIDAGEVCDRQLHDYKRAIQYYQKVIELYPSHKNARKAQDKINDAEKKITPVQEQTTEKEN